MHRERMMTVAIIGMFLLAGCNALDGDSPDRPTVTPAPVPANEFTGFALVEPTESGETYLGSISFVRGETKQVGLRIGNGKRSAVNYTIVVHIQRINITGDKLRVIKQNTLAQFTTSVSAGESKTVIRNITPKMTGKKYPHYLSVLQIKPASNADDG